MYGNHNIGILGPEYQEKTQTIAESLSEKNKAMQTRPSIDGTFVI